MKTINCLEKSLCTGCGACYNVCPFNAIKMEYNNEGFLYPVINMEKCTNCGKCLNICPQINFKINNKEQKQCYAMMAKDDIREKSSSGGIFTLLAETIINEGGYVVGASFTEDFKSVKHIIVNSIEGLEKLKKSKYLQSDIKLTYQETKKLLNENKMVLFSGTPCQIVGLKTYLEKEYEKLFTLDIVCYGVPSPKVWEKYINEISKNKKVVNADFRNKKCAWGSGNLLLSLQLEDNSVIEETSDKNIYYKAFLQNLILRKSCATCRYTNVSRVGDITLGDFWGIQKYNKKLTDGKGTSLVFVNNKKGQNLIDKIKQKLKLNKQVPIKYAINGNLVLKEPCSTHQERDLFFKNFENKTFTENANNCFNVKYDGILANMWCCDNVGANLTAWAIQQYFKNYNLDFRYANYAFIPEEKIPKQILNFRKKHLKFTLPISSLKELKLLNQKSDTFVVGSDQVFRYIYVKNIIEYFLFTYTDFSQKRVAFSASFGKDKFDEANIQEKYAFSKALKRFDYVSTRESSGVDICKNEFDIEAEHIFDPVFLIEREKYSEIIEDSNLNFENKILSFILDENESTDGLLKDLSGKYKLKIEKLQFRKGVAPADFLKAIKTAKYIVTDSFHGACFSIIFHKKFICLVNKERGKARFDSLINSFGIDKCFIEETEKVKNLKEPFENIDYEIINKKIEKEKQKAKQWFEKVFLNEKEITQEKFINELNYLNKDINEDFVEDKLYENMNIEKPNISFLQQLFSVKNDGNHKVLRILGIKIKFKRKNK